MSDYLVNLGKNPTARKVISTLGLPIPVPQALRRSDEPWAAQPLQGRELAVIPSGDDAVARVLSRTLHGAGASLHVEASTLDGTPWTTRTGHARPLSAGESPADLHGIVLDATALSEVSELSTLRDTIAPRLGSLKRNGRVLVIARAHEEAPSPTTAAVRRAVEGFVRALAREVGGKGITANLLVLHEGAEEALEGPVRWFLSVRSAFVTGQPLHLGGGRAPRSAAPWTRPLEGKVALVTGAAQGIGARTARVLAREGAQVLLLDRPEEAERLAETARAARGTPLGVDVTDPGAAARVREALEPFGGLDILVHNAGVTRDKTLKRMDDARWNLVMAVNVQAILSLTEGLDDLLNEDARLVALSSISGIAGNFGQTNYSASKAAVIGFIEATSRVLADRGITVNGVAPGFIETRMTATIPAATREAARRLSCLVQGGVPDDVAQAVTFLASPGAWGVQGRVLRVCGGAFVGA